VRLAAPTNPLVVETSNYLAEVYLKRPVREPRGLVNAGTAISAGDLKQYVGKQGLARMKELGVTIEGGRLLDPRTGARWYPIAKPNSFQLPSISAGMEVYHRITGNEDAMDWTVAYGQAAAYVLYQRHGNQHGNLLTDFPVKGVVRDLASWTTPESNRWAEGVRMSGYLAQFHPDVPGRAYWLSGAPMLKQRAYDYWFAGSHRGYQAAKMMPTDRVGRWVNYYSDHSESVCFTGRTFYIHSHPRGDEAPPASIGDLKVSVRGESAAVTFTAPADVGGKVVRYQVKCSHRPIVDYEQFLKAFSKNDDSQVCNWWMATNLTGESMPADPGTRELFTVTGVPKNARYFAVRSFDDSSNRSAMSNAAARDRAKP